MLKNPRDRIFNNLLGGMYDEQLQMDKYWLRRECLSLVFATLPQTVTEALNIARPQQLQLEVVYVDEDENVVLRADTQQASASLYWDPSLLFCADEWTGAKQGTKRPLFVNKGTIVFANDDEKTTRSSAKAVGSASVHGTIEKDVVDDVEPSTDSALREGMNTGLSECIREMFLYAAFIYNTDFRKLLEVHNR